MESSKPIYLFSELYEQYLNDELLSGWSLVYMSEEEIKNSIHTKFNFELDLNGKIIFVEYSCTNVPETSRVFESLVDDARSGSYTFDEFCDAFGFNNDSIKDRRIYKACKKNSAKLLELLGEELFNRFINCEMDL
jgi:hypothetical protein